MHENTGSQRDAASTIFNLPNYRVTDAVDLLDGGRRVVIASTVPPGRNLSTFLGHLLSFVVEFAGGVFSSWSGGLIQAVVGNAGGTGWWRTNRSGWAI